MKKTLALALAVAAGSAVPTDEAVAGGVMVHNYSGKHVNVYVGRYSGGTTRCSPYFSVPCADEGQRIFNYYTYSEATAYYLKPGASVFVEDNYRSSKPGGYMQVFAGEVVKGEYNRKRTRMVWHGNLDKVASPTRKGKEWKLCNSSWNMFNWNSKASAPDKPYTSGRPAWDPEKCYSYTYPFYFYTGTDVLQYDLVLTPENSKKGYY